MAAPGPEGSARLSLGVCMPTLHVENVPDNLYEALRIRADANRRSIAAEVISILEKNFPTEEELRRRREACDRLAELRTQPPLSPGPFPSAEEMIREDRER
jgi:plasmid stability protein